MFRRPLVALLLPILLAACGEEPASEPTPTPAADADAPPAPGEPSPLSLDARPGIPGRRPPVRVLGGVDGVTVTVFRSADPADLLADPESIPADGLETVVTAPARADWYFLPELPAGLYLAEARRGTETARALLPVTDLALIVKRSREEVLVFVADAGGGAAVPRARVVVAGPDGTAEGRSDANGVYRARASPGPTARILALRKDRVGFATTEHRPPPEEGRAGYVSADRPSYRPGETVHAIAVYRTRKGAEYGRASGVEGRFRVLDATGGILAEAPAEGTDPLHAALDLPATAGAGSARIVVKIDGAEFAAPIRIMAKDAPPFHVDLTLRRDRASIRATGPRGERLPGRKVEYRLEPTTPGPPVVSGEGVLDARGRLATSFSLPAPGTWRFVVRVTDRTGTEVAAEDTVTVAGETVGETDSPAADPPPGAISLIPDRPSYAPGEKARIRIWLREDLRGVALLETVEGLDLGSHAVESGEPGFHSFEVAVPRRLGRRIRFAAAAVRGRHACRTSATVDVRDPARELRLAVSPGSGGAVRLALEGGDGEPVAGTVALSVYDAALGPAPAPPIEALFRGPTRIEVATAISFPDEFDGVGGAESAPDLPPSVGDPRAAASGFWDPAISVPAEGAVVEVPPPDGAGRRRVVATAVAEDGRVASASTTIEAASPVSVDLVAPAFLVEQDVAVIRALAANEGGEPRTGVLAVRAEGLLPLESGTGEVTLPAGGELARDVPVSARRPGPARLSAWFGAGEGTLRESALDVRPRSTEGAETAAGPLPAGRSLVYLRLPSGIEPASARLVVRITGGPVAALARARDALPAAPPESPAALADWLVAQVAVGSEPSVWRPGVLRLRALEGEDGGWAWSGAGPSEPEVTERVRDALRLADAAEAADFADGESLSREEMNRRLDAREGALWSTPRETAAALRSLAAFARRHGEGRGEEARVRILVGNAIVGAFTLDREALLRTGAKVEVPARYLRPGRVPVTFEAGDGADLRYSARLSWREPWEERGPEERGIAVSRRVERIRIDEGKPWAEPIEGAVEVDALLRVTVDVSGDRPLRHVRLEVPIPAGTSILDRAPALGAIASPLPDGARRVVRDDRAVFLLPAVGNTTTRLAFFLRVFAAGRFTILPATAIAAGEPAVRGASASGVLYVE